MFWSHVALLHIAPHMLEVLPGNQSYKDDDGIYFFNDLLGAGMLVFAGATAALQVILASLLVRSWIVRDPPIPNKEVQVGKESGKG